MIIFFILIGFGAVLLNNGSTQEITNYPLECIVRQFNFTPTVADINGKKCRGLISTKSCSGSCESVEYGIEEYPITVNTSPTCNYDETITLTAILTNCDPGVHASATVYRYIEAVSCVCKKCNPKVQNCRTIPNRRSQEITATRQYETERDNNLPTRRTKRTGHKRLVHTNKINSRF